jgi:tetratricopeptide (TPR) repeat protein
MYLYNLQGKFRRSLELYRHVLNTMEDLEHKRYEFYLHYLMAYHHLLFGQPDHAVEHIEKMKALAFEDEYPYRFRLALCAEGEYHVETGSLGEARSAAKELKGLIDTGLNADTEVKHYFGLMGRIEHGQENYSQAIEYYEKGLPLFSAEAQPDAFLLLFLNGLAEVYFEAGNWEKAREAYQEILVMTYNRYYLGALYAKSFYWLGRICEQLGDAAQAIEYYGKFLDLWKDADPGIVEVEDAKRRLTMS